MWWAPGWQIHRGRIRGREHDREVFQGWDIERILRHWAPALNAVSYTACGQPLAGTPEILELKDRKFVTIFCSWKVCKYEVWDIVKARCHQRRSSSWCFYYTMTLNICFYDFFSSHSNFLHREALWDQICVITIPAQSLLCTDRGSRQRHSNTKAGYRKRKWHDAYQLMMQDRQITFKHSPFIISEFLACHLWGKSMKQLQR